MGDKKHSCLHLIVLLII